MNQRELLEYIRSEHAKSSTKDQIMAHLTGVGYPTADIEEAFRVYQKNPMFSMGSPGVLKRRYPFRAFVAILAFLCAAFGVLCALVSMNAVDLPMQQFPFNVLYDVYLGMQNQFDSVMSGIAPYQIPSPTIERPSGQATAASSSVPTSQVIASSTVPIAPAAPVSANQPSSDGITADDRSAIIAALLTQDKVLQSGDAVSVRNYLEIIAPPDDLGKLRGMSDADVLNYAVGILYGTASVGADALGSPEAVWQRASASTVSVTIPVSGGHATRSSTELDGIWY